MPYVPSPFTQGLLMNLNSENSILKPRAKPQEMKAQTLIRQGEKEQKPKKKNPDQERIEERLNILL